MEVLKSTESPTAVVETTTETPTQAEPLKVTGIACLYNEAPKEDSIFWTTMEKEFNVDYSVEWVPVDTYSQKIDLLLAGGNLPDVVQIAGSGVSMSAPSIQKATIAGAFWELDELLGKDFANYPSFKENTVLDAWSLNTVKGKTYLIPNTRGTINVGYMLRKDWLDALNMDTPKTLDEFKEYVIAVGNSDLDNNGQKDSVGMIPYTFNGWFDDAFGARTPTYNNEGGLIYPYFTSNYADMVEYFREIYAAGGIAKEYAMIKWQQAEEMFMAGTLGAFEKNFWNLYRYEENYEKNNPTAKIEVITHLEGPKGVANNRDTGYMGGHVFAKKTVDEAKMKQILSWFEKMVDPKYFNFIFYGVEGVHWNLVDGMPVATEQGKLEITNSNTQPFTWAIDEWSKVNSPLATKAENEAMQKKVSILYELERNMPITAVLQSSTWSTEWSKYKSEFEAMEVKAVTGAISMDEFRQYQQSFADSPDFKNAFKELAASYDELLGTK